jgi:hypothetical protein
VLKSVGYFILLYPLLLFLLSGSIGPIRIGSCPARCNSYNILWHATLTVFKSPFQLPKPHYCSRGHSSSIVLSRSYLGLLIFLDSDSSAFAKLCTSFSRLVCVCARNDASINTVAAPQDVMLVLFAAWGYL